MQWHALYTSKANSFSSSLMSKMQSWYDYRRMHATACALCEYVITDKLLN